MHSFLNEGFSAQFSVRGLSLCQNCVIPMAGWLTALAVVVSVAVVSHSQWIWIVVLFALWRVLQDYLFRTRIMERHLRIHPLAAIFAILVGAEVGESS